MGQAKKIIIEVGDTKVPAKVYREYRSNVRYSLGKRGAILRLPALMPGFIRKKEIEKFKRWVSLQINQNDRLKRPFEEKKYETGDLLQVGEKSYRLRVQFEDRKTHSGRLDGDVIFLKLSREEQGPGLQKNIRHLLSRIVAHDFLPSITKRVHDINQRHFGQEINGVRLKYNLSNWGSCSNSGNINLSTRLLFAPHDVIDYVIIHELAHLIEFNHSSKFWEIIAAVMPDYKSKEQWLKENNHLCDF